MTDLIQALENITSKFSIPKEITNINLTITTEDGSYSMSYNRHPTARSLGMYSIKDSFNSFLQKVDNLRSSASTNSLNPLTLSREHVIDFSEFIIDVNDSCKLKRKKHN